MLHPTTPTPTPIPTISAFPLAAFVPPPAVLLRNIAMVYDSEAEPFQALKAIDLTIPAGTVQLVMSPAGAGKTTLLLIVAELLTPTTGQVELLGQSLHQMSRSQLAQFRLQHMGIVFQDNNLLHTLTALENVEVALNLKGIHGNSCHRQARRLLESVGLGDKLNHLPRQLSGGQMQRVGVARALAEKPQLIIADEPTAALDSTNGRLVTDLLCNLAREEGCTVLIATHDERIMSFSDRIVYLEDGMLRV